MVKPKIDEYFGLIERKLSINTCSLKESYETITDNLLNEISKSDFYKQLIDKLRALNDKYRSEKQYTLINTEKSLNLKIKKFENMQEKSFRIDVLKNEKWKNSNEKWIDDYNWITPLNCFEKLNDIIRTRVFIRYLDGVKLVLEVLDKLAEIHNYKAETTFKSDVKGYYGVHFVVKFPVSITNFYSETESILVNIEIQICTQISEVINELLHRYYEKQRLDISGIDKDWQWNYECDEFMPAYLGHMSHYIEGMIMEARKKIPKKEN